LRVADDGVGLGESRPAGRGGDGLVRFSCRTVAVVRSDAAVQ
jgi:hypothetical protein